MIVLDSAAAVAIFNRDGQASEAIITCGEPCLLPGVNTHETASVPRVRHGLVADLRPALSL